APTPVGAAPSSRGGAGGDGDRLSGFLGAPLELEGELLGAVLDLVLDHQGRVAWDLEALALDLDAKGLAALEGIREASQGLDEFRYGYVLLDITLCHGRTIAQRAARRHHDQAGRATLEATDDAVEVERPRSC